MSSPGLEYYLQLNEAQSIQFAAMLPLLMDELQQCDLHRRGFMQLEISQDKVQCHWHFVSSVKQKEYLLQKGFSHSHLA